MLVKTLVVGHLETNCYVVTNEKTLECVVIDPGAESNAILDYLESNHLTCRAIMLTHTHFDHVTALPAVLSETNAAVYLCSREVGAQSGSRHGFTPPEGAIYYDDGDEISAAGLTFSIIATPGHTPGGISIVCEDALFSGDTLFRGSCGRTDLEGGSMTEELRSLKRLASLPGDYEVYPGHAEASTLSIEREHNPYMRRAMEMSF